MIDISPRVQRLIVRSFPYLPFKVVYKKGVGIPVAYQPGHTHGSRAQDEQLTMLKGYIHTGFPCDKKNLLTDLHEFGLHREMLSIKSGLITCGTRIIVPREIRPEMLQYIHEGHQGRSTASLEQRTLCFGPRSPITSNSSWRSILSARSMKSLSHS